MGAVGVCDKKESKRSEFLTETRRQKLQPLTLSHCPITNVLNPFFFVLSLSSPPHHFTLHPEISSPVSNPRKAIKFHNHNHPSQIRASLMVSFILSRSFLVLLMSLIALSSRTSISEANSSFSFTSSDKDANFESDDIAMYGDAKLVDGGSSIRLTDSVSQDGGRVVYKKPIEFVETKSEYFAGFSTVFSFSISPGRGGRLGFVAFPVNGTFDHYLFEVKFETSDNLTKFGDTNVVVIVDGATVSEKISNFTITKSEKTEKVLLYAWINYQAGGKFLEVRLSKSESFESVFPLIFYRIDLSEMLKGEDEFMVGVNSYSGNVNLHSWSLEVRSSAFEHSYVPLFLVENLRKEEVAKKKRRERMWEIVTCFVMTFGSTGLVFFAMMHIWTAFKRNNLVMVMQEECGIKTKEFEYEKMEKMEVVMSKADAKQETK